MTEPEIKPSFSSRYLALTIVTTILVSGVTLLFNKITADKETNKLIVGEQEIVNLIKPLSLPDSQIKAIYFLAESPDETIESYFSKIFTIENVSNQGVEDVSLTITLKETNANLINTPNFKTNPPEILDGIKITKKDTSSDERKHVWNISLLNPQEKIIVEYSAYSKEKIDSITLSALPRKKNWSIEREPPKSDVTNSVQKWFFIGILTLATCLLLLNKFSDLLFMNIYKKEWERNAAIREQYKDLETYYWRHFPPPFLRYFRR